MAVETWQWFVPVGIVAAAVAWMIYVVKVEGSDNVELTKQQ